LTAKKNPIPHDILEHLLDAEKLKNCFECGICTSSCPMNELLPQNYNPRILLEKIYHSPEEALKSPAIWLCAWCYRCHHRCPQKLKLPEIFLTVRKIAQEKGELDGFRQAQEMINQKIPFPTAFTYVCLHPERAGLEKNFEKIHRNPAEKRKKTDFSEEKQPVKVAIVGAGPAGLTAAYELAQKGYSVTVFESSSKPGGMLQQCIPSFRLPRDCLDAEINRIKDIGVEIKTNMKIGNDVKVDQLWEQGFKAILVSTGAHKTRKLNVEGEDLKGVFDALDFLRRANENGTIKTGTHVVVVGGGNVATDSARTAVRQGAKDVTILYRRSRDEMPANPYEVKEAMEEGIKIQFLVAPRRVLGENGSVKGLECVKMELGEPDETGRKKPRIIEGSEFTVPADTVIFAVGEAPDISFLPKEVETGEGSTIAVEPFTTATSQTGIFACGDCVTGPATVIEAVLAGKKAAEEIDCYLKSGKVPKTGEILAEEKKT
jgi:NADPH-dependent glutamate synthase beta subunit-like oxidoreductase